MRSNQEISSDSSACDIQLLVLGSGGFNNRGLPYVSFMLGGHTLVECPPDIMQSLASQGVDPAAITTIVLSHLHGDHCFGLPFLVFALHREHSHDPAFRLKLAGPNGTMERSVQLLSLAISPLSSYVSWFKEHVDFIQTQGSASLLLPGMRLRFHPVLHKLENYAVSVWFGQTEKPEFLYISDTMWGPSISFLFTMGARIIFCDANGSPGDESVHMSPAQIVAMGFPFKSPGSVVYANHLNGVPGQDMHGLTPLSAGMRFCLGSAREQETGLPVKA